MSISYDISTFLRMSEKMKIRYKFFFHISILAMLIF